MESGLKGLGEPPFKPGFFKMNRKLSKSHISLINTPGVLFKYFHARNPSVLYLNNATVQY